MSRMAQTELERLEQLGDVMQLRRAELEQAINTGVDPEQIVAQFGKPPHWFVQEVAPPYTDFTVNASDALGRQYMWLGPQRWAVRLPLVQKSLSFPAIGETVVLQPRGTSIALHFYISNVALPPRRKNPKTALLEGKAA